MKWCSVTKTYNLYLTFQLHVHGKGDYLEFEQAQYVMGVAENKPAGTVVGSTRSDNLLEIFPLGSFCFRFVPSYFLDQVGWGSREQPGSEFAPGQMAGEA